MSHAPSGMTAEDIQRFLAKEFPAALDAGFEIDRIDAEGLTLSLATAQKHLRPGGTLSGPTLMTMADTAAYFLILARLGPVAMAVTSSLEMHFLRRPEMGVLYADCRLLKLGRRNAVATVSLRVNDSDTTVAFATVTYAIPDR